MLTLRVRDNRVNPTTGRRDFHYPTFVVFGRESDKALTHLVRRQEIAIEYKLETRNKMIDGERKYFEDKVATRITYGRKPVTTEPDESNRPTELSFEISDDEVADETVGDLPMEDN